MELILPVCLLLAALIIVGMPIAFAMGITGAIGLYLVGGMDAMLGILSTATYRNTASWTLTAVPLFVFMAEVLTASRLSADMFDAANKWFGRLPGGMAIATIFAAAGFGAVSGSSTAAAATFARTVVPEGIRHGYQAGMMTGAVAAAGTLAIMIPPSIIMVIYGILTETSIGALFVAGLVPGLMTAVAYALAVVVWVRRNPGSVPPSVRHTWTERLASLRRIWPVVLLFATVVGGMYGGVVTVTEVAAAGAVGALAIGALVLRRLSWRDLSEALERTTRTTAMIFAIVIGAHIFSYFLTMTLATQHLVGFVAGLDVPRGVILAILIGIYLILGCLMDQLAILVLTVPIVFPVMMKLGYDPVWFGILITMTVEIGLITPPFGMNIFVVSSITGTPLREVFRGVMPFVLAALVVLLICAVFPGLVTWTT